MQAVADLLHCILTAQPAFTFHKVSMHAAMTPSDIGEKLRSAFQQALVLKASHEFHDSSSQMTSHFTSPGLMTVTKESSKSLFHHVKYPLVHSAYNVRETSPSSSPSDTSDSDGCATPPPQLYIQDASFVPDILPPYSIISPAGSVTTSKRSLVPSSLCPKPAPAIKIPFVTVCKINITIQDIC